MTKIPINVSLNKWLINILRFTLIIQEKVVSTLLLFHILKNKEKQTNINTHRCNRNHTILRYAMAGSPQYYQCFQQHHTISALTSCFWKFLIPLLKDKVATLLPTSTTYQRHLPWCTPHTKFLYIKHTFKILLFKILFPKKLLNSIFILLTLSS